MQQEQVFVYRIGELGDTLVSLPAMRAIAMRHPEAQISLITNPRLHPSHVDAWQVLQHTGVFSDVIRLGTQLPMALRVAARLRSHRNPVLYYLAPARTHAQLVRDALVFRTLGGAQIRGMEKSARLQPGAKAADGSLVRRTPEWRRLLEATGARISDVPSGPLLVPPAAAREKVSHLLSPVSASRLIGLGPGSKMPAKKWFEERFIELAREACQRESDVGIAVLGGPEDAAIGERVLAALPARRAVNLAGKTNIIESAAALSRCTVYVGNDTGTMHLAASMNTPCVAIFTSRDSPGKWEPWGAGHTILRHDLPCSGCMLTVCEREQMRCLDLISVKDVLQALDRTLAARNFLPTANSQPGK